MSLSIPDFFLSLVVELSAPHLFSKRLERLDELGHPDVGSFIDWCTLVLGVLATAVSESFHEAELVEILRAAHAQRLKVLRYELFALERTSLIQVVEDELVAEGVPFLGRQQLLVIGRRHHLYQHFSCFEPLPL